MKPLDFTTSTERQRRDLAFCDFCGSRERVRRLKLGGRACEACMPLARRSAGSPVDGRR